MKKDSNLHVFNVITGINESKTITEHIICKCECKFDSKNITRIKNGITINVGVSVKIQKNIICAKKNHIWNPATCSCKNGKYVESIIDDSVVICDEIKKEAETIPTKVLHQKLFQ